MKMTESELLADLAELERIQALVQRTRITKCLALEKARLENELQRVKKVDTKPAVKKVPTTTITSYAWDQSDKFVKIYLSNLNGIQNLDKGDVSLQEEGQYRAVQVRNLNGKTYTFTVPKLAHPVVSATMKIKTDMILIMLKKQEEKKWEVLTEKEQIAKDEKLKQPPMGKEDEPGDSMMKLMKKMYDDGDDDMKRTIAKAWTESREKQQV